MGSRFSLRSEPIRSCKMELWRLQKEVVSSGRIAFHRMIGTVCLRSSLVKKFTGNLAESKRGLKRTQLDREEMVSRVPKKSPTHFQSIGKCIRRRVCIAEPNY